MLRLAADAVNLNNLDDWKEFHDSRIETRSARLFLAAGFASKASTAVSVVRKTCPCLHYCSFHFARAGVLSRHYLGLLAITNQEARVTIRKPVRKPTARIQLAVDFSMLERI